MGLFKRAAVRGMAHELVRQHVISFPSKQAMDEAADAVADAAPPSIPEVAPEGGHGPEDVAMIAQKLIEIATALQAQAGIGADPGAPPGAPPLPMEPEGGGPPPPEAVEASKAAAYLHKEAAYTPVEDLAVNAAIAVMTKAAEEKTANPKGALMHGGDAPNTPAEAAKNDSVGALDLKQRPESAYSGAMGHTALDTAKGELGHQGKPSVTPTNSPSGSNSVNSDAHKSAAVLKLRESLKQAASTLVGVASTSSTKNKQTDSAKTDSVAALDLKNRPLGTYVVEQGGANFSEDAAARVGKEQKHPMTPANSPAGSNSVTQASKLSEEDAFFFLFDKCAEDAGPYLPPSFTDEQKVAAIKDMIGLDKPGRQAYITSAYAKVAAEKNASDVTDPQSKDVSLMDRVKNIANSAART